MKVTLEDYNLKEPDQASLLGKIANQSRTRTPTLNPRLFKDTLNWGHKSIQEFAFFIFHVEDVSRVLLAQLTRHRIASYNVVSSRKVPPTKGCVPKGIYGYTGEIYVDKFGKINWFVKENGEFKIQTRRNRNPNFIIDGIPEDCPVKLEDIRMCFPSGLLISLYFGINGSSLRNFLSLRMTDHAQWEIRILACKIYDLVEKINPVLLTGFEDKREEYRELVP